MPLSRGEKAKFKKWVERHNLGASCPACGASRGWTVNESLISGMELHPRGRNQVDARVSKLPMFLMACKNCQYVMLFAAAPILALGE